MARPREYVALDWLIQLSEPIVADPLTFDTANGTLLMAHFMFHKQRYHAKSVLALVDVEQDHDALLVARSALEGFALLKWASQDSESRANDWIGFGIVEELRHQERLSTLSKPKDPEIEREIDKFLDKFAQRLILQEYRDRLEGKSKKKQVPKDMYARDWIPFQDMRLLFVNAGIETHHQHYDRASKWMHSTPRAIASMLENSRSDEEVANGYSKEAELAVLISANAFHHCLEQLVEHFEEQLPESLVAEFRSIRRESEN